MIEEIVEELETLIPIDVDFHTYQQGRLKPLGAGLYRCDLFNDNNAVCGYAMYDNGTSVYCDEPHWKGYCIVDADADNSIYCEHCNEFIYTEDARYMEDAPVSAPVHYDKLRKEHDDVCWSNPQNKHLLKEWSKEIASNFTYGLTEMLENLNVSKFSVVKENKTHSIDF